MRRSITLFNLLFVCFGLYAQNGPGGVGTTDGTSSLLLWLKADDISSVPADGDQVLLWNDHSGYGNDYIPSTPTKPVFKQSVLNGDPSVSFGGSTYMQCVNSIPISGDATVFVVHIKEGNTEIFSLFSGADNLVIQNGGAVSVVGGTFDYMLAPSCVNTVDWYETVLLSAHFKSGTDNSTFYFNGLEGVSPGINANMPAFIGSATSYLGKGNSLAYYEGYIAEVILFDREITFMERKAIERYLNCKYFMARATCSEIPLLSCSVDTFHFYPCETRPYVLTNKTSGADNYRWYKDYELIPGENQQDLFFGIFDSTMFGYYYSVAEYNTGVWTSTNIAFYDSIKPAVSDTAYLTICTSDSLIIDDSLILQSGIYFDTLNSSFNCDSFVTYFVTVNEADVDTVDLFYCLSVINDTAWPYPETVTDSALNINGCDSLTFKRINFYPQFYDTSWLSICSKDSLYIGGNLIDSSGTYKEEYLSQNACDSIYIYFVTVKTEEVFYDTLKVCASDTLSSSWPPDSSLKVYLGSNGCDSVVKTVLEYLNSFSFTVNVTLGIGEYVTINGVEVTDSGTYYDSLTALNGCDSIIKYLISKKSLILDSSNFTFCAHDTLVPYWPFVDTNTYYYTTSNGSDSVVKRNLTIIPEDVYSVDTFVCLNESFFLGGEEINFPGIYSDTVYKGFGCYDITEYNLSFYDLPDPIQIENTTICNGNAIQILLPQGVSAHWKDGYSDSLRNIESTGTYYIIIENENCTVEQAVEIDEVLFDKDSYKKIVSPPTCIDGNNGSLQLLPPNYIINWDDKTTGSLRSDLLSGVYYFEVLASSNCSLVDSVYIPNAPKSIVNFELIKPTCDLINDGSIMLTSVFGEHPPYKLLWKNEGDSSYISDLFSGVYHYSLFDSSGCEEKGKVILVPENPTCIVIPNVFTPNADGVHDTWNFGKINDVFKVINVVLYDRWGRQIFHKDNFLEWDGCNYKGTPVPVGTYYYIIYLDGFSTEGFVTVLR